MASHEERGLTFRGAMVAKVQDGSFERRDLRTLRLLRYALASTARDLEAKSAFVDFRLSRPTVVRRSWRASPERLLPEDVRRQAWGDCRFA